MYPKEIIRKLDNNLYRKITFEMLHLTWKNWKQTNY